MMLIAAGLPMRQLGLVAGVGATLVALFALFEPYRRARLTSFLDPWDHASGAGFQSVQGQIAIGSGGLFGHGLGASIQKIFYVPEAHTDFILAVIGEELGLAGILGLLCLYGIIGYAGLQTAKKAKGIYAKLLAGGLTSLILCQALLNVYAVLGLAPLTGVPLPFISSGSTSLIVLLGAMGLLLNVASGGHAHALNAVPRDRRPSVTEPPRIVIAAGGTAGHVVPAIAIADALRAEGAEVTLRRRPARRGRARPAGRLRARHDQRRGHQPHQPAEGRPRRRQGAAPRVDAARKILKQRTGGRRPRRRRLRRRPGRPRRGHGRRSRSCSPRPTRHLGLTNRALASRAQTRLPRLPARGPRRRPVPRDRPRRPAHLHRPRPRPRPARHRPGRDLRARLRRLARRQARSTPPPPRPSRTRPTASSTSPARATTRTSRAPARTTSCSST